MANETTVTKEASREVTGAEHTREGFYYRPLVDILERPEELLLLADLPGATPEGIDIHFEDGLLSIHAKVPARNENVEFLLAEFGVGDYFRTFQVNETIDSSKISAEYADGVLTLHLPKTEAAKPRKIAVKA